MAVGASAERRWVWAGKTPLASFRGPLAAFWRGLGYQVAWEENELVGERELGGQHRQFRAGLAQPSDGTVEVHCSVRFTGAEVPAGGAEIATPQNLLAMLDGALARGFGPASGTA